MNPLKFSRFLVRLRAGDHVGFAAVHRGFLAAGVRFELEPEPILRTAPSTPGAGLQAGGWQWHIAHAPPALTGAHAWELAHDSLQQGLGATGGAEVFIEPDFEQQWVEPPPPSAPGLAAAGAVCMFEDQDTDLPGVPGHFAWHLQREFSQLGDARASVAGTNRGAVRIAHLDTGYDPKHTALAGVQLARELARNFAGGPRDDATDPGVSGLMRAPGHGTGTLSILAGGRFAFGGSGYTFDDLLGGAPEARIVPVRVGNAVVQISTSSVAAGIGYAADLAADPATRVHVISMSMGGVASLAWADAVNRAYEEGIVFVAAAGNNFSAGLFGVPTRFIVYPARFKRVLAACGAMADRKPYYGLSLGTMQGNWGPDSKMATALAAFTPNIAWATYGCEDIVRMSGQGTSAATPQVAAAAALYFQKHLPTLFDPARYPEPWMRAEAVRAALLSSAQPVADEDDAGMIGRGILQAADALEIAPAPRQNLQKQPEDRASFSFLRALTGLGLTGDNAAAMLALEATQLAQRSYGDESAPNLFELVGADPDVAEGELSPVQRRKLIDALLDHPAASRQLKSHLAQARAGGNGGRSVPPPRTTGRGGAGRGGREAAPAAPEITGVPFAAPNPPARSLRGFAIDPSLATSFNTAAISEVTISLPWEDIAPGPTDEYIEVIDIDPASGCAYEPVNLNEPKLLAQDGLPPSQGTPQFHQQMAYAVARLTIENFELALGRPALWRPGPPPAGAHPKDDSNFVRRLRLYPHALREQNAYYAPDKVAVLFGYFNASSDDPGEHLPGGRVFTCLSHDIVAHEVTHALLDGMHRQFLRPSNPDVHAFHEAFADLVALFQHFTFPEILKHQIASTRGDIAAHETLLGQLAGEFGRATGQRRALRDAIGQRVNGVWRRGKPKPAEYEQTTEPHARGAILVAAVFDAFLTIYQRRTDDLLRLATGGSGVLRPGAIHPDLVQRLAGEATKAAGHVLRMCVRALDYCPPVDITFGEYLRAIITADCDLVADDDLNYRVAFIEAFRRRGIYPRNVRTLSVESLVWSSVDDQPCKPSLVMQEELRRLRTYANDQLYAGSRRALFDQQREMRRALHTWLKAHFRRGAVGETDAAALGLAPKLPFEVHSARFAYRVSPDGTVKPQLLLGILQEVEVPVDESDPHGEQMAVEGGCSIVADLSSSSIGYCIRKSIQSSTRVERQRSFSLRGDRALGATYFGPAGIGGDGEPFAALHRNH